MAIASLTTASAQQMQQLLQHQDTALHENQDYTQQQSLVSTISVVLDMLNCALQKTHSGELTSARQIVTNASKTVLEGVSQTAANDVAIRIHVLGQFSIFVHGTDLIAEPRSAPRVMELLKCIIAFGSRQVNQHRIMECLWPEMNGDAAVNVFSTTLSRLRKLLGNKQAIILKSEQVTLNTNLIWVDVWELEHNLDQILKLIHSTAISNNYIEALFESIRLICRGPFLGEDKDYLWSLRYKDHINSRMLKFYSKLGSFWLGQSHYDNAQKCFELGIQLDPLHENFYQNLMETFIAQQRYPEAAHVYHQCRKNFARLLNVTPSKNTVNLYYNILSE